MKTTTNMVEYNYNDGSYAGWLVETPPGTNNLTY